MKCLNNWEHVAFWRMWLWVFSTRQEYHGPVALQQYEEFGIDILGFADNLMHLLYLGIKKFMINMIPTCLKQRLRQNKDFERLASKLLDQWRENALDWSNTNKFTNKDGSVSKTGNHLTIRHSQGFPSQFTVILIAYRMKTN